MQAVPMTLNNGIYLQTREFNYKTHLDSAHLMHMDAGQPTDATDLGMITPWITTGYMEKPGMWNLIGQGKNRVLYTEGNIYKWKNPIAEQPTYIIEDVSNMDKPGLGETEFQIKLNKKMFGNSAIISPNKFGGIELYVTPREIRQDGDGFIYWVRMNSTNKKYKWFPKEYLQAGTIFFQIGSVIGEYGEKYNELGNPSSGYREFYNYVGQGYANISFSCTRDAAYSKVSNQAVFGLQQYRKVIEMYQLHPSSAAYDISRTGQSPVGFYMEKGMDEKSATERVQKEIVKRAWIPEVEALAKVTVERDVEHYAMWGSGGVLDVEGHTKVHMPVGLFHQLNLGPAYNYNIPKFNLSKLDSWITSRLKDKIDPYGQNIVRIGTGFGGLKLVRSQIKDVAQSMGLTYDSERYVKGNDNQKLYLDGPNFISYRMSFGIVQFELISSLDPIEANDLENPFVDGYRLSSYLFIIDDLTASNENIHEIVYGPDFDFHHFYINGRMNYMDSAGFGGRSGPYQASNLSAGFEVFIEKRHKCYWVKDITKSLMIKPINPRTGKPIFDPVF